MAAKKKEIVKAEAATAAKAKKVVDTKDIAAVDASHLNGKSAKIRFYLSKGFARNVIATHLGIRYQHVRNVEVTLLKKDITK